MLRRVCSRSVPLVLFVLALSGLPSQPVHAGTIHVTSNKDTDQDNLDGCTLREAMKSAFDELDRNECAGTTDAPNTIVFDGNYTITVENTLPDAINDVTVDGNGKTVVISGGHTDRIFRLSLDSSDLKVQNLALKDAESGGGAAAVVEQQGAKLTMTNVTISGCHGISNGAAINSLGAVTLTNVSFSNNNADQDGGAIWMGAGTILTITDSTFTSNGAKLNGGAIYLTGVNTSDPNDPHPVVLTNTTFTLNHADGEGAQKGGGAIWAVGGDGPEDVFLITNSQFISNSAPKGGGGAILLALNSRLAYATPLLPSAGGIYACNFFDNSSGGTDDVNVGMGGAIFNRGIMTVVASSFVNNSSDASSGGAIGHNAGSSNHLTVANVTFSGNQAQVSGGAIANLHSSGEVDIINSTFSENKVTTGEGGSVFNDGLMTMSNSVLTTLGPGENCGGDPISDGGHNLQFPDDSCGNAAMANPLLGPATIHPGPNLFVVTMEPAVGSPALGNGDNSTCNAGPIIGLDARALLRPQGDADCDIGAMESANLPPFAALDLMPDGGLSFGFVVSGTSSSAMTASVNNLGNTTITGMVFSLGGPSSRSGGTCATTLSANATCTVDVKFTPIGVGPQDGSLLVQADGGLLDSILLTGTGVAAAALELQPAAGINFGNVLTGTTAGPFTAVLTNIGGVAATNIAVSLSSDFAISGGTCGPTLASGASCDIPVTFHPATDGLKTANLKATAAGGLLVQIALSGSGFTPPPGVDLTPNAGLDFGPVIVGDGDVLPATVTNSGAVPVTVTTRSITGSPDFDFQIGPPLPGDCGNPPFTLVVGAHCVIQITVAPDSNGPRNGTLHVGGAGQIGDSIPLFAVGHTPGLDLIPDTGLNFGMVAEVNYSVPLVATIVNTGLSTHPNVSITVAPAGAFFRADGGTCPSGAFNLAPASSCTVRVIFYPVFPVTYNASLRSEDTDGHLNAIPLHGTGFQPNPSFDLNPDPGLDFGLVQTFTAGEKLVAKLDNPGDVAVNGVGVSASAGFTITGNTCGSTLQPESGCLLEVTATPGFDGPNTGTLSATAAGGLLNQIGLVVTGFTPSPSLTLTPAGGLDFGFISTAAPSASKLVTVHNDGNAALTQLNITTGGPFGIVLGGNCLSTVPAHSNCTVAIRFAPSTDGAQIETLTAQANGGLIDAVTLKGVGYTTGQTATFGSSPTAPGPVNFGNATIHRAVTKTLTIQENGDNTDLILTNPKLGGANAADFSFSGSAFPMLVKNGQSKVLTLTCIPGAATLRTGTLVMSSNNPAKSTVSFNLQCTGIRELDSAAPWALAFLAVLLGLFGVAALSSTRGWSRGAGPSHGSGGLL